MYILARASHGRPTLMHKLMGYYNGKPNTAYTACGLVVSGWSRAYLDKPIPQVLCKKCGKLP